MDTFNESLGLKIPGHVAVILDGNGRWAKKRHLPRTMGHVQGSKVVEDMLYVVDELGVKYFTVYAFSTENWKRSTEEVSTLMGILRTYLKDCVKKSMKNNVRCRVIGRKDELSQDIIDSINNLEEKTKNNTGLNFTIAINYGGRDEITRAVRKIAGKVSEGSLKPEDIDEDTISNNLDTWELPDPDLLIRTSGEQRLSNYAGSLLIQNFISQIFIGLILTGKNLLKHLRNIIRRKEDSAELRRSRLCVQEL